MRNRKPAKPTDWKTEKLPEIRAKIPLNRLFSREQMKQIMNGLVPEGMEDRWFIFWDGENLLFHRSWTGFCIYIVRFVREQSGSRMVEAQVNRDPSQYTADDHIHDVKLIDSLINTFLLH